MKNATKGFLAVLALPLLAAGCTAYMFSGVSYENAPEDVAVGCARAEVKRITGLDNPFIGAAAIASARAGRHFVVGLRTSDAHYTCNVEVRDPDAYLCTATCS